MKKKRYSIPVYSPICRFYGWEISKLENKGLGYKQYIAYFLDSPQEKPIKLQSDSLKKLEAKIIGINLKKGVC